MSLKILAFRTAPIYLIVTLQVAISYSLSASMAAVPVEQPCTLTANATFSELTAAAQDLFPELQGHKLVFEYDEDGDTFTVTNDRSFQSRVLEFRESHGKRLRLRAVPKLAAEQPESIVQSGISDFYKRVPAPDSRSRKRARHAEDGHDGDRKDGKEEKDDSDDKDKDKDVEIGDADAIDEREYGEAAEKKKTALGLYLARNCGLVFFVVTACSL